MTGGWLRDARVPHAVCAHCTDDAGSAAAALGWMPALRSRAVVGWWLGSLAELDEQVLRPLWLQVGEQGGSAGGAKT